MDNFGKRYFVKISYAIASFLIMSFLALGGLFINNAAVANAASNADLNINYNYGVKIGILPYKMISASSAKYAYIYGSIPVLLSSDLASSNIFVARNSNIKSFIYENHINSYSTPELAKISKNFNLNYIVFGRIVKIGNVFVIQSSVFNTKDASVSYRHSMQVVGKNNIISKINDLAKLLKGNLVTVSSNSPVSSNSSPVSSSSSLNSRVFQKTTPSTSSGRALKSSIFIKRYTLNSSGLSRTESKQYVIHTFAAGHFLNKGVQAVVATRHRIILYNLSINGEMTKITQYHLSTRSNTIYVGIYHISQGNNAIVLTKSKLGMIISSIFVYRNGKIVKIGGNYNLFLRVMKIDGKQVIVGQNPISVAPSGRYFGDFVVGQNYYPIGQFGGKTYTYRFNKSTGSLYKVEYLPFFKGITLYGTVYGNIKGDGENYLLALSNSGNLMLINKKGKTIYTGNKTYGGSPLQVRVPSFGGVKNSTYTGGLIYSVPAEMTKVSDNLIGKTGETNKARTIGKTETIEKEEIMVLKNYSTGAFLHHLNYYTKSSIFNLVWNKIGFYPAWEIKPVTGYSAGFSIFRSGGKIFIADAIVKNPGSLLTKPQSYIVIYEIS